MDATTKFEHISNIFRSVEHNKYFICNNFHQPALEHWHNTF